MQSMLEKQENLKYMFLSTEWSGCKYATQPKGIAAYNTIVSQSFWTNLSFCVEVFKPLVKLLRLVDGDLRPSMGFIYGQIKDAKKEVITICKDVKETYNPIMYIVDSRIKDRLDGPLHLTGYLLNPYYYYRDDEAKNDSNCMGAFITCVEAFFPDDFQIQNVVSNIELHKYKAMKGIFSKKLAISGRIKNNDDFNPVAWWSNYGSEAPNLQKMTMKILGLTTSSSGCERNWSTFEGIHTKKRNRLDSERLNDLVYVKFNSKLLNKNKKLKENCDPLLANDARMAQEWIVDGGDDDESEGSTITCNETNISNDPIRELDEDDFLSEDEEPFFNDDHMFGDIHNERW
ncbi:uncharacterized protein LOC141714834 [Apium graveolens]|uniref:uncharacterized protein LOC141714834 n=1 Tax=Apium graveolens TaxID=4045 RepID=UPI003D7BFC92